MFRNKGRLFQISVFLLFLVLIIGLVATLASSDNKSLEDGDRSGAIAALDSPLPPPPVPTLSAEQPIPIPRDYFPTPIPVDQKDSIQAEWLTYEMPGEGITFKARQDWPAGHGKAPTRQYSTIRMAFWDTDGGVALLQRDNPQKMSLEQFAKTSATAYGSPHNQKWLTADIKQFSKDVSNSQYKRLLIVRDDSANDVTSSINGFAKYVVLIAYEQRVVIARSQGAMSPLAEQHFWEVIDSIRLTAIH